MPTPAGWPEDRFSSGRFRARDQPDGDDGEGEAGESSSGWVRLPGRRRPASGWLRPATRRSEPSGPFVPRPARDRRWPARILQIAPASSAQTMLARCGKCIVLSERDREHQHECADVRERGEHEGVGAARSVSAGKVGRAPQKYRRHAVSGRRELGQRGHAERGYHGAKRKQEVSPRLTWSKPLVLAGGGARATPGLGTRNSLPGTAFPRVRISTRRFLASATILRHQVLRVQV